AYETLYKSARDLAALINLSRIVNPMLNHAEAEEMCKDMAFSMYIYTYPSETATSSDELTSVQQAEATSLVSEIELQGFTMNFSIQVVNWSTFDWDSFFANERARINQDAQAAADKSFKYGMNTYSYNIVNEKSSVAIEPRLEADYVWDSSKEWYKQQCTFRDATNEEDTSCLIYPDPFSVTVRHAGESYGIHGDSFGDYSSITSTSGSVMGGSQFTGSLSFTGGTECVIINGTVSIDGNYITSFTNKRLDFYPNTLSGY
ncbi:MAG: hypothetical protein IJP90_01605, partial [Treponema sp.]|nr:hypothetical protein [Treponema sp.]